MIDPLPELWGPEHCEIMADLVPNSGPADTVQGEVLRAALRVTAEFSSGGCGNWKADPAFFDGIVDFLLAHLCDGTFDAETEAVTRNLLGRVRAYGHCDLDRRSRDEYVALDRQLGTVDQLALAWCLRHAELIPRQSRGGGRG